MSEELAILKATPADLIARIRALPDDQQFDADDFVTLHHHADGVYVRELHIPAGFGIVGRKHKTRHVCMLIKGTLALATEGEPRILESPSIFVANAGSQKIGVALTDCVFVNVHATNETDLKKIEEQVVEAKEIV